MPMFEITEVVWVDLLKQNMKNSDSALKSVTLVIVSLEKAYVLLYEYINFPTPILDRWCF